METRSSRRLRLSTGVPPPPPQKRTTQAKSGFELFMQETELEPFAAMNHWRRDMSNAERDAYQTRCEEIAHHQKQQLTTEKQA